MHQMGRRSEMISEIVNQAWRHRMCSNQRMGGRRAFDIRYHSLTAMQPTGRCGEMIRVIGHPAGLRMNLAACQAKQAEACWGGRRVLNPF